MCDHPNGYASRYSQVYVILGGTSTVSTYGWSQTHGFYIGGSQARKLLERLWVIVWCVSKLGPYPLEVLGLAVDVEGCVST